MRIAHIFFYSILFSSFSLEAKPSKLEELKKVIGKPSVSPRNIMTQNFKSVGEVSGSNRDSNYLTNGDSVFLKMNVPVSVGDVFSIFKDLGPIKKSYQFQENSVNRIRLLGEVYITDVKSGWVVGTIMNAKGDIQRGAKIGRSLNLRVQLDPQEPQSALRGKILGGSEGEHMIGTHRFTFIDKGSKDGLRVNDRLFVMRASEKINKEDKNFPEVAIAEIIVVHLDENYATAYVLGGSENFEAGSSFKTAISEEKYLD